MSYGFYKVVHLFGILLLFISLGTLAATARAEGGPLKRIAGAAHGIALIIVLVAGFGLMARLNMFGSIALWAWAKIGLWFLLGLAVLPLRRKPDWAVWLCMAAVGRDTPSQATIG